MENIGAVTYNESKYFFKGFISEEKHLQRACVTLHELSHMWFGNFVTMKWWDDLWLNESFATFIAYLALDQIPSLKQKYDGGWLRFFVYK